MLTRMLIVFTNGGANDKRFKLDINTVHVRDLNFVLRFEIFVHFNGQLRASHLSLSCALIYMSFQDPRQALTVVAL